jgi:hypothetical protein
VLIDNGFTKIEKEGSMKKVLLFALVLLLAIPAASFAGSATSRWDLTIGGYVKVDAGYSTQNVGPNSSSPGGIENYFASPNDYQGHQAPWNKAGSYTEAAGQSALNFLVKGPDTWGAKTSAFIQGSFTGQTTNAGNNGTRYGTFSLSHAYMDFTWATTKLMVGYNWQSWSFLPSYNFIGLYDLLLAGRGNTVPQITLTQNFSKSFYGSIGIQEPYNNRDGVGGSAAVGTPIALVGASSSGVTAANTAASLETVRITSQLPDITAELGYKSDACGKIGPNMMQFAVGGFWGQDTVIYPNLTASGAVNSASYSSGTVDRWAGSFKFYVPIIPEKNLNKAGAMSLSGNVWTGQNLENWFLGARAIGSIAPYNASASNPNFHVPVTTGGWGQFQYYFTDKVYFNALYGYLQNDMSKWYAWSPTVNATVGQAANNGVSQIKRNQQYIANVFYDVNPAVRVALEYTYIATDWSHYVGAWSHYGDVQTARVAFFYFF